MCLCVSSPRTGREEPDAEYRYNSTLSLTSALDTAGGQRHVSAALPAGVQWYPLYRRLGGPQYSWQPRDLSSGETTWSVRLHIHLDSVLRFRMCGVITPLCCKYVCRGA